MVLGLSQSEAGHILLAKVSFTSVLNGEVASYLQRAGYCMVMTPEDCDRVTGHYDSSEILFTQVNSPNAEYWQQVQGASNGTCFALFHISVCAVV